jgi:predicted lipoprotein with Yx(FWY)xxD motif
MRIRWQAAAGLMAAAFLVTACGPGSSGGSGNASGAQASSAAPSASAVSVALKTAQTSLGTILASAGGYTLYYYSADKPNSGTSVCTGSCATAWPPLTGTVQAPPGVTLPGPLGEITRQGGAKQITINGYPIYLFAGDHAPGQVTGNGADGQWHVIKLAASSSGTSGSSSSTSGSSSSTSGSSSSTSGSTSSTPGSGGGGGY